MCISLRSLFACNFFSPPSLWNSCSINKCLTIFSCPIHSSCLLKKIQFTQNFILLSFLHPQYFPTLLILVRPRAKCTFNFDYVGGRWQVISTIKSYLKWKQKQSIIDSKTSLLLPSYHIYFQKQNYICKCFLIFLGKY